MTDEIVYQKLTQTFRNVFDDDDLVLTPQLTAKEVDEWDSLTHVRLVLAIEKAFDIRFSAAEVARLQNVGELASLIRTKASQ